MNKPKIVVLDGFILNPGDISWGEIESISDLTVYDRTDYNKVYEAAKDAWGILNSKVVIDRKLMQSLPNLKYIGMLATGYNMIDIEAAKELGIPAFGVCYHLESYNKTKMQWYKTDEFHFEYHG